MKNHMKMKLFLGLCLCLVAAYLGYNYVYQEHRDVQKEQAVFNLNSTTLFQEFSENEETSNAKYINQIISVSGEVNYVTEHQIVLIPGIVCQLDSSLSIKDIQQGDILQLKGRCIGFDDLFMEVRMDNITFK
jgi:hypothetical protein